MLRKTNLHQLNYRGQRSSSHSKFTNLNRFDPYDCEIDNKYLNQHYSIFNSSKSDLIVKKSSLHPQFIMPITVEDVEKKLDSLPSQFLEGLKGVMLLGGSNKQLKTAYSNLSCYGAYSDRVIFLAPFPRKQLTISSVNLPAPHLKKDYEKAGAIYFFKNDNWYRYFSLSALKTFYLNDVLVHELGHHVDRHSQNDRDAEKYAEWFAREYGYPKS